MKTIRVYTPTAGEESAYRRGVLSGLMVARRALLDGRSVRDLDVYTGRELLAWRRRPLDETTTPVPLIPSHTPARAGTSPAGLTPRGPVPQKGSS